MILLHGHDDVVAGWLAYKHGVHVLQAPSVVLGILDSAGTLRGAFVLTWRNDTSAELHVYGALSNDAVKGLFRHAFGPAGIHRLEVRTPRTHKKVRKAARKFGFQFEGVARDYYGPGADGFTFGMTARECRWLERH